MPEATPDVAEVPEPTAEAAVAEVAAAELEVPAAPEADHPVVSGFEEIDALLEQAVPEAPPEPATPPQEEGLGEAG